MRARTIAVTNDGGSSLAGIKIIDRLAARYCERGFTIRFDMQTNGTLIDAGAFNFSGVAIKPSLPTAAELNVARRCSSLRRSCSSAICLRSDCAIVRIAEAASEAITSSTSTSSSSYNPGV